MFYYPQHMYCPQYMYYVYILSNQSNSHDLSNVQEQSQPSNKFPVPQNSPIEQEKLVLTREDLEKQGYEQTKRPWSKEEDKLLLKLCKNENARFQQIASKIQGRNAKMCYSRYRRLTYQTRINWTKQENQRLLQLVDQFGDNNWKEMVHMFEGRTHKQLRDHYMNYLKPDLLKSEWTIDEDLDLVRLINHYGKKWDEIERSFKGRSRSQIKNRYFGRILRLNKKKIEQSL